MPPESLEPTAQSREPTARDPFIVRDLGRMGYAEAFGLQKQLQQEVIGWRESGETSGHGNAPAFGYVLLVEHDPPVITVSRRKTARQHLIATPETLEAAGVEVAETDRGGDITYHGPGQLVVYPILDLNRLGLRLHGYMRFLEDAVIDTLARFDIDGERDESATGVWVKASEAMRRKQRASGTVGERSDAQETTCLRHGPQHRKTDRIRSLSPPRKSAPWACASRVGFRCTGWR